MAEITQEQIDNAIVSAATKPKSQSLDGASMTQQDVDSLIKLDKYRARRNVSGLGIRCGRMANSGSSL